jgi:hypothetical protein
MDRLPFATEGMLSEVADMYPACCSRAVAYCPIGAQANEVKNLLANVDTDYRQ